MQTYRLLIDGYTRDCQKLLKNNLIIPSSIHDLCFQYFYSFIILIHLREKNKYVMHLASIDYSLSSSPQNISCKCNILPFGQHNWYIIQALGSKITHISDQHAFCIMIIMAYQRKTIKQFHKLLYHYHDMT